MNTARRIHELSDKRRGLFVAAGSVAVLIVGTAASAVALRGHETKVRFAVFARVGTRAPAAGSSPGLPAGAMLAAVNSTDGVVSEIYVAKAADGEVCLTDRQVGKGGATACGRPAEVEANGGQVGVRGPDTPTSVAVLVPDGTPNATMADTNGATHVVAATNNVVAATDPNLATVTYTMPDGAGKVFRIPPRDPQSTSPPSAIVP